MRKLMLFTCALVLMVATSGICAQTPLYTSDITLNPTDWTANVSLPQFDPNLGNLTGIYVELFGHIEGLAQFENEGTAGTFWLNLQGRLALQRPDKSDLVVTIPVFQTTPESVDGYDGTPDYGGNSGRTYGNLSADKSENAWITVLTPADLALFVGGGNISLPVAAAAQSCHGGGGNVSTHFETKASATAKVMYTYEPVPEPSSLLALLSGMSSLAGMVYLKKR